MEVNGIFLLKKNMTLDTDAKIAIQRIFKEIYKNVQKNNFQIYLEGENIDISYQLSACNENMVFMRFEHKGSSLRVARILDYCKTRLTRGAHRKDWNIIITYDESSHLHCCRLMPYLGLFERKIRELVYCTIINVFGIEWYAKSFNKQLKDKLRKNGMKESELIEEALQELTYEQLRQYLFGTFTHLEVSGVLTNELSRENTIELRKDEIIEILDKCRTTTLWNEFFGHYSELNDLDQTIDKFRQYRNKVMHNKSISSEEYESIRKELKFIINPNYSRSKIFAI